MGSEPASGYGRRQLIGSSAGNAGIEGISIPAIEPTGESALMVPPCIVGALIASAARANTLAHADTTSWGLGFGMMGFT